MPGNAEHLDHLVSAIYDCAVDPQLWPLALAEMSSVLGCSYASLHSFCKQPAWQVESVHHSPWDACMVERVTHYLADIPALDELVHGPLDTPIATLERVPFEQIRRTAFYQEWVEPQGLHDACLTKVGESGNRIVQLSVVNNQRQGRVSRAQQALVARLSPHIRRAVMIGDLTQRQSTALAAQRAALDALRCGIVLTDGAGRVDHANTCAAHLLARGEVLRLQHGCLFATQAETRGLLREALQRAHQGDLPLGVRGIGLPLRSAKGACCVAYVLPLNQSPARTPSGAPTVALYLSEQTEALPIEEAVLQSMFGMTAAEAHLVHLACQGGSVAQLARLARVSTNTVKTHIQRAFDKTGTHSRAELSALVLRLLPPIGVGPPDLSSPNQPVHQANSIV